MTRLLRVLFLLLTFLGVGLRVSDLHAMASDISHQVCEHDHHHDDDHNAPDPCQDPQHHHHQCTCVQPIFCLPEFPKASISVLEIRQALRLDRRAWSLPEDPVYALEIPPIIG